MSLEKLDLYLDYAHRIGANAGEIQRFIAGYLVTQGASYRVADIVAGLSNEDEEEEQDEEEKAVVSKKAPKSADDIPKLPKIGNTLVFAGTSPPRSPRAYMSPRVYGESSEASSSHSNECHECDVVPQLNLLSPRSGLKVVDSQWLSDEDEDDPLAEEVKNMIPALYSTEEHYGENREVPEELLPICSSEDGSC